VSERLFWRQKRLGEMNGEEWEALCDGCAKCCLNKLEDIESGEIAYTEVACRLLDLESCRCTNYAERRRLVADCVSLEPGLVENLGWLPSTCAYRLMSEGRPLPDWHPLVSGDSESVHRAGISVRGRVLSERDAGALEEHVVIWPE
jgi:uncharacterized cysteine cluster protein YcgN (CxxCxxCC family)